MTVRARHTRGGVVVTRETRTPDGLLRVDAAYQAVCVSEDWTGDSPDVYILVSRTAWLDGEMITDPARAAELAAAA